MTNLTTLASRSGSGAPRRSIVALVIGVTLVGCSGYEQFLLLDLAARVEMYFTFGGFERDVAEAVDFAQKVLGSGGL
ncbi:MAG: hypothetical protein WDZ96_04020 [Acidimicrobiia bacterium]